MRVAVGAMAWLALGRTVVTTCPPKLEYVVDHKDLDDFVRDPDGQFFLTNIDTEALANLAVA